MGWRKLWESQLAEEGFGVSYSLVIVQNGATTST